MTENNKSDWRYTPNLMWSSVEAKSDIEEIKIEAIGARKAVQDRYFHWRFGYTLILLLGLGIARFTGAITQSWQVGAWMFLFLTTLFLVAYLPWNSKYNRYLKEGETEEEIGYRLRGKKRPIKVLKVRPSERADFRRFHYSRKYTAMMIFSIVVSGIIAGIAGTWWLFWPYLVIATPCIGAFYLQWNGMVRDWLERGHTEVEARETARDIERSAAADCGGDDGDVFWDPTYSSLPYNAYHK